MHEIDFVVRFGGASTSINIGLSEEATKARLSDESQAFEKPAKADSISNFLHSESIWNKNKLKLCIQVSKTPTLSYTWVMHSGSDDLKFSLLIT